MKFQVELIVCSHLNTMQHICTKLEKFGVEQQQQQLAIQYCFESAVAIFR